jgi:hypothetical protein
MSTDRHEAAPQHGEQDGTSQLPDLPAKTEPAEGDEGVKGGRKAGGVQEDYLKVTMNDIIISS